MQETLVFPEEAMKDFYQSALAIARRKLFRDASPGKLNSPRLGSGGYFENIFLWDTVFSSHWAKYHMDEFPLLASLDNFYLCQEDDGFIPREIQPDGISVWSKNHPVSFAPPLLSWIELELQQRNLCPGRLAEVYPHLVKLHRFNQRWRQHDGLYFCDMLGCGMDDIPRYNTSEDLRQKGIEFTRETVLNTGEKGDRLYNIYKNHLFTNMEWNRQLAWVDTSCQVAFDTLNLEKIALMLNKENEAESYHAEYMNLKNLINEKLYDEKRGFYCDRLQNGFNSHLHIGGFWALIAEVAIPERARRLCEHLTNPETFGLPCGTPGIAYNDAQFSLDRNSYWRGPIWCPVQYMVLCGLKRYHKDDLARDLARRFYNATLNIWKNTGTIWENYSPLQMETPALFAAPEFCGWSALAPITIYREFLQ